MSARLPNKTIVIIGGTTGLGLSAARACVAEEANLVVVGRNQTNVDAAVKSLGDASRGFAGDAIQPSTAQSAIQLAVDTFGRLDGFFHVAGGSGRKRGDGPLDEITDEGWQHTLQLNLTSLFNSNRAAVRQFLLQESAGSVLNMGSVLADSPSSRYFATHTYAATKAAAIGLTTASAAYYADRNIRFNIIAPALVDTPLAERAKNDSQIMSYIRTKQPLDGGRIGVPGDLDAAVVFLLSDESQFVTGQVLKVDGGWSVTEGQYG